MDNSWENLEPSPIEFFHGLLMDKFHEFRLKRTENIDVTINGMELNSIIADCKRETYQKYAVLKLDKAVPKSVLKGEEEGICACTASHVTESKNVKKVFIIGSDPACIDVSALSKAIDDFEFVGITQVDELKRPKPEDLTLEMIHRPIIDPSTFKTKRTNHERQPASFGKGNNKRRKR